MYSSEILQKKENKSIGFSRFGGANKHEWGGIFKYQRLGVEILKISEWIKFLGKINIWLQKLKKKKLYTIEEATLELTQLGKL